MWEIDAGNAGTSGCDPQALRFAETESAVLELWRVERRDDLTAAPVCLAKFEVLNSALRHAYKSGPGQYVITREDGTEVRRMFVETDVSPGKEDKYG